MPRQLGKDEKGMFVRWGNTGHKYYFTNARERDEAEMKALAQGYAIHYAKTRYRKQPLGRITNN